MARFYPTTIVALGVIVVLVIFFITVPKLKKTADELDQAKKHIIQKDDVNALPKKEKLQDIREEVAEVKQRRRDKLDKNLDVDFNKVRVENVENPKGDGGSEAVDDDYDEADPDHSDNSVIKVMVSSDNKTLGGLVAAVNSIWQNTNAHVKFYLLVDEVSVPHLRKWIQQTELSDIDYVLKAFNESLVKNKIKVRDARQDLGSPLNFARYYFPLVFPSIEGRLIFIDADSIVQGDIQELWDTHLEPGHAAAFSDDCSSISHRSNLVQTKYMDFLNFKNPTIKALNLSPMACSFNTGVYVIDVKEWKKQKITEQLDRWLALNSFEELYGTQRGGGNSGPPFYIVFYNKYTHMSPAWNVRYLGLTPGTRYSDSFVKSAKLLHWNGPFKPWGRTAQHTDEWDKYYISDPTGKFKVVRMYGNI
ncbi:Glycosyltransferase 8 domain-containing protein 1 [Holothuria leucospilota]|uniref:Glycosyltransferase 8 domain-containing protein 1 n=1 Tax=Holothuria leucospilota TaxID=206669 RepID=A0A9Q0YK42_HOLLE|nr:Glycosyltransferase 8 domain-containing protein 1 [Holothuria leucospilota]